MMASRCTTLRNLPRSSFATLHDTHISEPNAFRLARRLYATNTSINTTGTSKSRPRSQRVTVFNDDGSVKWGDLTATEKVARTTQQSFNFSLIAAGAAATVVVFMLLYTDVFSSESHVSHYNSAVDRLRADPQCQQILGSDISALPESRGSAWRRARIRPRLETDRFGTERMYMHFQVEGSKAKGVMSLYMLRRQDESRFEYGHLALDVPGQQRIYLENGDKSTKKGSSGTFLGIRWR